jgi:hypothetical protein
MNHLICNTRVVIRLPNRIFEIRTALVRGLARDPAILLGKAGIAIYLCIPLPQECFHLFKTQALVNLPTVGLIVYCE